MNLNTITMNFNVRVINLFSVLCKMFKIFVISGSIFHIKFDFLLLYGSSLLQTYTSFAEPLVIFTNTGVQITVRTQLNFIHLKPKNITFYCFIRWTHSSLFREQLIFFTQILLRRLHYTARLTSCLQILMIILALAVSL